MKHAIAQSNSYYLSYSSQSPNDLAITPSHLETPLDCSELSLNCLEVFTNHSELPLNRLAIPPSHIEISLSSSDLPLNCLELFTNCSELPLNHLTIALSHLEVSLCSSELSPDCLEITLRDSEVSLNRIKAPPKPIEMPPKRECSINCVTYNFNDNYVLSEGLLKTYFHDSTIHNHILVFLET